MHDCLAKRPSCVTINEYLDAAKSAPGCRTDARRAECLGVVQSRISHYRQGRVLPNIHMARRLAIVLNIRAATLINDIRKDSIARTLSLPGIRAARPPRSRRSLPNPRARTPRPARPNQHCFHSTGDASYVGSAPRNFRRQALPKSSASDSTPCHRRRRSHA
jgi:transcriptional regulator with XRE-family HTH domain